MHTIKFLLISVFFLYCLVEKAVALVSGCCVFRNLHRLIHSVKVTMKAAPLGSALDDMSRARAKPRKGRCFRCFHSGRSADGLVPLSAVALIIYLVPGVIPYLKYFILVTFTLCPHSFFRVTLSCRMHAGGEGIHPYCADVVGLNLAVPCQGTPQNAVFHYLKND